MTHVAFVSGQLDIYCVKRDEKRRYYAKKLSYKDAKNNKNLKNLALVHCLKTLENKTLLNIQLKRSPIH